MVVKQTTFISASSSHRKHILGWTY